jgi:hypothetical protein
MLTVQACVWAGHPHPIDLFSSISPATIYPFHFIRQLFVAALHARSGMGLYQNRLKSCSYFRYPLHTIHIENSIWIFNLYSLLSEYIYRHNTCTTVSPGRVENNYTLSKLAWGLSFELTCGTSCLARFVMELHVNFGKWSAQVELLAARVRRRSSSRMTTTSQRQSKIG